MWQILKICDIFDKYNVSYYCFVKNEDDWGYGNKNQTPEEKQKEFESLDDIKSIDEITKEIIEHLDTELKKESYIIKRMTRFWGKYDK